MSADTAQRFRDPAFLAIWERWQKARSDWRIAQWLIRRHEGGSDPFYNPNPDNISNAEFRAKAIEFIEARKAYKAELQRWEQMP